MRLLSSVIVLALVAGPAFAAEQPPRALDTSSKPWKGDFDRMLERRMIRVLIPFSRTFFFNDKGHERGVTAELARHWERYINRKYAVKLGRRPVTVYLIPTTRDKLLPHVASGLGDIAAGNLTVTEERLQVLDFVSGQQLRPINEIVVAAADAPPIATADDLSGKTVHVRKASSYYESLVDLNERFAKERKPPVKLVPLPDALEDEDAMEMVNAGVLSILIIDDWKANIWAPYLPKLKVISGAVVRAGARTGWGVRKGSPKLTAELTDFYENYVKKHGVVGALHADVRRRAKEMKNNTGDREMKRFEELLALFRKYGDRYDFDPLMLAAQGFQESRLDQSARSRNGAIGVMQIMPATGAQLKVGDIRITEPNIHAGVKYMDHIMANYFADAKFSEGNRALFAFASYNCGPGNVERMRKLARQRNLDPDRWFNNVEIVVAEKIGGETTTYVRNIYKYYVAYKLTLESAEEQRKLREQMEKRG